MSTSSQENGLTVCLVFHSEKSRRLAELNCRLAGTLNPGIPAQWLVADNTPEGTLQFNAHGNDVRVIRGLAFADLPSEIIPHARGSFHHAMALGKLIAEVKTRFLLVLDSDFYIIRPWWMREALSHMRKENLAFFGSVWHPKYYAKYRYFPSVHCFFADLGRVRKEELDFRPAAGFKGRERGETLPDRVYLERWPWLIRRAVQAATFQDRKFIGSSRDTGYRIYQAFHAREDMRRECLQPVLKRTAHFGRIANLFSLPNALLEKFLPDRLCFIPKDTAYYSTVGFRERGLFDVHGQGWEEYLWKGEPFGFHLRGTKSGYKGKKAQGGGKKDTEFVESILARFVKS